MAFSGHIRFRAFDWDATNVEHIALHHVEPVEAEAACRGAGIVVRGREGRYLAYGCTLAGRCLFVVLRVIDPGVARVITARDMTERERRFFRKRRR